MPEPNPEKTREALLALAGLFAPGDTEVRRQALLAHDDPEGYVKAFAARLDERGINSPEPNLTVIALSDALQERQRVFIVDHRSPAEDIEGGLRTTLTALGLDAAKLLRWYDEGEWINKNAAAFLEDGNIELTNNRRERELRRLVLGRRNWLFTWLDLGGERTASILTVVGTCIGHDVNPRAYLHLVAKLIVQGWPHELLPDRMLAAHAELYIGDIPSSLRPAVPPVRPPRRLCLQRGA